MRRDGYNEAGLTFIKVVHKHTLRVSYIEKELKNTNI